MVMDDKELDERVGRVIAQGDELVGKALASIEAMRELTENAGLPLDIGQKLAAGGHVSEEQQRQARSELEAFVGELEADQRAAREAVEAGRHPAPHLRRDTLRI